MHLSDGSGRRLVICVLNLISCKTGHRVAPGHSCRPRECVWSGWRLVIRAGPESVCGVVAPGHSCAESYFM